MSGLIFWSYNNIIKVKKHIDNAIFKLAPFKNGRPNLNLDTAKTLAIVIIGGLSKIYKVMK
ncbi:hypothetical protein [Staphylococcus ratti]|uniref:Uncharacterized protein n=1 Tax=Staphylococcus ratti TaxID=2892440 RepID=A0ABY3PBI2_9STAP|nr:hypothetical protein [Staphylococcus ratti]UEX89676.1 hypothetical protein LN051_08875 [Staphylococcus ratti]